MLKKLIWLGILFAGLVAKSAHADYGGPPLVLPLPAGYTWQLNTGVNDSGDDFHQNQGYYSLDFARRSQDNTGHVVDNDPNTKGTIDVLAAAAGTVVKVVYTGCAKRIGDNNGMPCLVAIDHGGGYVTKYLHLTIDTVPDDVRVGKWVEQGQYLGKMGTTGISGGTHLHFQIMHQETSPLPADPLRKNNDARTKYTDTFDYFDAKLNKTVHYFLDSSRLNPALVGVRLGGIAFSEYTEEKVGSFYPSTNTFTLPTESNPPTPHTCSNQPSGGN